MFQSLRRFAVASALVAVVPSQTFVVDVNNGPGTNFTSLATALNAAPDGATLIVRAGSYGTSSSVVVVNGKGMTILGEPGAVTSSLIFSGLGTNQHLVVKGMTFGSLLTLPMGILQLQSCQGRIHVEDCRGNATFSSLSITNCTQATVIGCSYPTGATFITSNVVCIDTEMRGQSYTGPGLAITGGRTQLVNCSVTGASNPFGSPGPGISMGNGWVRLLGNCSVSAGTGTASGSSFAVQGTGWVRSAPSVGFGSFPGTLPPTSPGISLVTVDEAATSSTRAPLGGVVTGRLEGSANLFGALVLGAPRPPVTFAGIAEELWVEPFGFVISGPLGAPLTFWLDVPNDTVLTGFVFGWQGLTFEAVGGFVLSNPAWFCVQ